MTAQLEGNVFGIDTHKYRVIDISYTVVPGSDPERPFDMSRGLLADNSYKFDVFNTHTHVGTHIESSAHFFDDGVSIDAYPLDSFFGRAIVLDVDIPDPETHVSVDYVRERIGDIIKENDIIVCRNLRGGWEVKRFLTEDVAHYFRAHMAKMIVFGSGVSMGESVAKGRRFHEILMRDTTFLEIVSGLDQITKRELFVIALPVLVKGLDSSWCRAVAIEER